jgi:non-lysosomal glucosylceramidase
VGGLPAGGLAPQHWRVWCFPSCAASLGRAQQNLNTKAKTLNDTWPHIRTSIEFLIGLDGDESGLLEGEQYNTLDAAWFGPMAWISSFYVAALRVGEAMAVEVGDGTFAERGAAQLVKQGGETLEVTLA